MTFKTFEKIAAVHRPDVIVSAHGDYCNNTSKNTLGIIFVKDGKQSKVYKYSGTYAEILNRLNIHIVTDTDLATLKNQLKDYQDRHGKKNIFTGKAADYSKEIAEIEQKISYYRTSKDIVREWEYE